MELRVVLGKHEVMCEFAGEPKLAALLTAVHTALRGLDQETFPTFGMKMMPEGLHLSDDSSVAALSSGSTIEVMPIDREMAVQILEEKGVSLAYDTPDLNEAAKRGDTETVRLMLLAWGDSVGSYTLYSTVRSALFTAVVNGNAPMCRIMFANGKCIPMLHGWQPLDHIDGLQSRDLVQLLVEHGVTGGTTFCDAFFLRAAQKGRDWVFTAFMPQDPDTLDRSLSEAVLANSVATVRAISSYNTLSQSWLSNALLLTVGASSSDSDMCRLLMELGAEVPRNISLHDATCLGFFDVLIEHGADLEDGCANGDPTPLLTATCPHKQQALIKLGANVNARDRDGFHILMRDPANLDVMSLAIAHGADVNAADSDGMTCLMHMCAQGECPPVSLLLDHGAKLEATDAKGATALWYADTKEVLMLLVQRGAAINSRDGEGVWFLHDLYGGDRYRSRFRCPPPDYATMLKWLVAQPHLDVNVRDSTGCTVLMRAAQSKGSIAFLLERADIDVSVQDSDGMTCLMHAASAKRVAACEEILAFSKANNRTTDVTVRDSNGWTSLMHAVSDANRCSSKPDKVRPKLIASLVSHGADPSVHNDDGLAALHIAVENKSDVTFAALLAAGACPNACNGERVPLLHILVSKNVAQFEALVAVPGLDINVRDNNGRTALMRVARSNGMTRCTALLENGADVAAQDNDGRTCLGHAAASGVAKVVTLLLDHGAGVNDGAVPPLLAAVLAASAPVCRVLLERGADVTEPAADGRTCVSVAAGLRCRGAKAVLTLVRDALGDGDGAKPEAASSQGAVRETPASGGSKRKRDDNEHPAGSTHACAVCGVVSLASGDPFPSAESVLRHASSKHRMRRSEYIRRFGE